MTPQPMLIERLSRQLCTRPISIRRDMRLVSNCRAAVSRNSGSQQECRVVSSSLATHKPMSLGRRLINKITAGAPSH